MKSQSKAILWSVLACVVLLGGLVWLTARSSDGANTPLGTSSLTAEETSYKFGTVSMAKGTVSHEFTLKNNGTEPVTVTKLSTSCMCTKASIATKDGSTGPFGMAGHGYIPSISVVIAPGEEATVLAVFDPAAHGPAGVGPVERQITVEQKDGAPIALGFSATVAP